jgi:hypothetical protein
MAATIVRPAGPIVARNDDRLIELVRDISGVTPEAATVAFLDAPPRPAEALERVAHALVSLRVSRRPRVLGYPVPGQPRPGRAAGLTGPPNLPAGPAWPDMTPAQGTRLASTSWTASSMQRSGSDRARVSP